MSKPAITILTIAALVLAAIVAVFVLRIEGKARREREESNHVASIESAEPAPMREPFVAAPSPPVDRKPAEVAAPRRPAPVGRDAGARLDEASLISQLHDLGASDPQRSLALAREAVARFPDSPNAPEFEWNVAKALANMDRYQEAEEEARRMLQRFPGNVFADDLEHHLLNHPPNPPAP
jgi:TolA-binding protein